LNVCVRVCLFACACECECLWAQIFARSASTPALPSSSSITTGALLCHAGHLSVCMCVFLPLCVCARACACAYPCVCVVSVCLCVRVRAQVRLSMGASAGWTAGSGSCTCIGLRLLPACGSRGRSVRWRCRWMSLWAFMCSESPTASSASSRKNLLSKACAGRSEKTGSLVDAACGNMVNAGATLNAQATDLWLKRAVLCNC